MAAVLEDSEAIADAVVAAGEERLRRHRAARDRARSVTNQRNLERTSGHGGTASAVELRAASDILSESRGAASLRTDSRTQRARSRQAPPGAIRRSPSATSRRPRGIPRGPSRGEATPGHDAGAMQHRQEPEDFEVRWQSYLKGEEYLTFHAAVESLKSLPPMDQLTERRVDFEVLLHLLHRLGYTLEVEHVSKSYRAHYSPDVQLCGYLYSTLLTAFTLLPTYVLNGQEFYVSDTVLDQCKSLQFVFQETCTELKKQFESLQSHTLEHIRNAVKNSLIYFDRSWCRFEMPALEEIEAIHRQACRPLIEAIEADQALLAGESKAGSLLRGSGAPGHQRVKLQVLRGRLIEKLCELNRLANVDGKGRADMDMACIYEAERIAAKPMCTHLRKDEGSPRNDASLSQDGSSLANPLKSLHKCSGCASPVLLRIARSVIKALERIRRILQRYANCLYQLNSHLANNRDLVRGLELFESAWETANRYLVQSSQRRLALLTYEIVSGVQDADFETALSSLDPGFLVASLPRAMIIHEMRRFAAAKAAALTEGGGSTTPAAPVRVLKGASATTVLPKIVSRAAVAPAAANMLPRSLELPRVPASAFQHSPIARTYLPAEVVDTYNETATALDRLPASRLPLICSLLCSPPRGSSRSTPLPPASAGLKRKSTGGAPRTPAPRTPCPPRMAVPNSSRPESNGVKTCTPRGAGRSPPMIGAANANPSATQAATQPSSQSLTIVPQQDESEDEDEFAIDLPMQGGDIGATIDDIGALSAAAEEALGTSSNNGQDPATRRVMSSISTMALHLQRSKPHEWNELIQVVLQGFMLVKSARTTSTTTCSPCAAVQPQQGAVPRNRAGSVPRNRAPIPTEVW